MSTWTLVPPLKAAFVQLDAEFPNRDRTTDGAKGDDEHAARVSSHNPDETGNPEFSDKDGINEVRAIDIDKDLRHATVTAEQVVQLWVKQCRAGLMPWIRYMIFNGRIWHVRDGYTTRVYTGSNKHTDHIHITSAFNQASDNLTTADYFLRYLRPSVPKPPTKPQILEVDGILGPKTISRWQQVMGTPVDGKIDSKDSALVRAVQKKLRIVDYRLQIDGEGIRQDGHRTRTIEALQRYLKCPVDGFLSVPTSRTIVALQRRLNENRF
jgi:Putative peptidoglycan-binding domain-containing protein